MTAYSTIMRASRSLEVCVGDEEYWMDLLDRLLGHDDWATTQLLELSRGLTDAQLCLLYTSPSPRDS